jgi:hypothetical protein
VEGGVSAAIPTRWVTQLRGQLSDADRRLTLAERRLADGQGGRALQEAYPGVMAAALVRVWLADEAWRRSRSLQEYTLMLGAKLPSGFAALAGMKGDSQSFAGWRVEDARPLIQEARAFVSSVREELDRRLAPPPSPRGPAGTEPRSA